MNTIPDLLREWEFQQNNRNAQLQFDGYDTVYKNIWTGNEWVKYPVGVPVYSLANKPHPTETTGE